MVTLEALANTALQRDSLRLRSLALDFMREHPELASVPRPSTSDQQVLATAAAHPPFAPSSLAAAPTTTSTAGSIKPMSPP